MLHWPMSYNGGWWSCRDSELATPRICINHHNSWRRSSSHCLWVFCPIASMRITKPCWSALETRRPSSPRATRGCWCHGCVAGNYDRTTGVCWKRRTGWWFQMFFIFTPTWGRFPFWLIFFKGVETTNERSLKTWFWWWIEKYPLLSIWCTWAVTAMCCHHLERAMIAPGLGNLWPWVRCLWFFEMRPLICGSTTRPPFEAFHHRRISHLTAWQSCFRIQRPQSRSTQVICGFSTGLSCGTNIWMLEGWPGIHWPSCLRSLRTSKHRERKCVAGCWNRFCLRPLVGTGWKPLKTQLPKTWIPSSLSGHPSHPRMTFQAAEPEPHRKKSGAKGIRSLQGAERLEVVKLFFLKKTSTIRSMVMVYLHSIPSCFRTLTIEITYTVILNKLPFMWISKSWVNISLPWDLQKKIRQSSKANVEHHGRTCARFLSLGKSLGWNLTSKKSCAVQGMVDSIKVSPYQL